MCSMDIYISRRDISRRESRFMQNNRARSTHYVVRVIRVSWCWRDNAHIGNATSNDFSPFTQGYPPAFRTPKDEEFACQLGRHHEHSIRSSSPSGRALRTELGRSHRDAFIAHVEIPSRIYAKLNGAIICGRRVWWKERVPTTPGELWA